MARYRNTTLAVINIGGHTVIAPTKSAEIDPKLRGVQRLIDDGRLVLVKGADEADGDDPTGSGEADEKPKTVAQLKKALTDLGAQFDEKAPKAELEAIYDSLVKAES